jgi:hypothetical protein
MSRLVIDNFVHVSTCDAYTPKPLPKGVFWWKITYAVNGDESRTNVANVKAKTEEDARSEFYKVARGQSKPIKIEKDRSNDSIAELIDRVRGGIKESTGDESWPDFKSWNEEYTKLLQKRNAAERAWNAERDPVKRAKLEEKFQRADAASESHRSDPNRPSSTATFVFGSRR